MKKQQPDFELFEQEYQACLNSLVEEALKPNISSLSDTITDKVVQKFSDFRVDVDGLQKNITRIISGEIRKTEKTIESFGDNLTTVETKLGELQEKSESDKAAFLKKFNETHNDISTQLINLRNVFSEAFSQEHDALVKQTKLVQDLSDMNKTLQSKIDMIDKFLKTQVKRQDEAETRLQRIVYFLWFLAVLNIIGVLAPFVHY